MTALGVVIVAGLWSAAVGCLWLAGLSLATGCGDNEVPPAEVPVLVQCAELGGDAQDNAPWCTTGCVLDGVACEVPRCAEVGPGEVRGPDGLPGCDQSLCYRSGVLCDQTRPGKGHPQ